MEIDTRMHNCLMTQAEERLANVSCCQANNMQMMYALMANQVNAWPGILAAIQTSMDMPKQPEKPIWKETEYYWIVVAHQVGPLKLLEIVLKEGYGDG